MGNLTTVQAFKQYINDQSRDRDPEYARILTAASGYIERYCGRTFAQATYTNELYDGSGREVLILKNWPIVTMTSIKENGAAITFGDDPAANPVPDVLVYKEEGKLVRPFNLFFKFRRYYSVTYDAGYAAAPPLIVQAALEVMLLMARKKDHVNLASKGAGQDTVTYENELTGAARAAIDLYRDLTFARAA